MAAKETVIGKFVNQILFKVDKSSVDDAKSAISEVKGFAAKALGVIGISFTKLASLAEEFGSINDTIRGATREMGDQADIQQKILQGAQDCREEYGVMAGLYSHRKGRRFLISESVRGEGALLLDKNGNRFTNELQPRDVVSAAIRAQMEKDSTDHVWVDMRPIGEAAIREHFPNILERCEEEGYDPIHEPIPVVPAQHYFMGGITADLSSRTALPRLYACGETCCNGVHGRNRLASNSLLESLVFAQRAADDILYGEPPVFTGDKPDLAPYREQEPLFAAYRQEVLTAIERSKNHE